MRRHLYLLLARASAEYPCQACGQVIPKGAQHYRHDPHPYARQFRGHPTTHWCRECIDAALPAPPERITKRIRVPVVRVVGDSGSDLIRRHTTLQPLRVKVLGISDVLVRQLAVDPTLLFKISPNEFEEVVCERLYAMGLEPKRVGNSNQRDGGVDILFWPRNRIAFPFVGAAQVKHHQAARFREGPASVRELAGVVAAHSLNAGLLVTNSTFTPDAKWFAREHARLLRLREFDDVSRWLQNSFGDEEWRDLPKTIELCPGIVIPIR